MTDVRALDGPFRAFLDPEFAGPKTKWRAVNVDDGSTWEACELSEIPVRMNAAPPHGTELRQDADTLASWVLAPSAAGATAGEIVDASMQQGARLDASFGVHIITSLAPAVLLDELRWSTLPSTHAMHSRLEAVSLDHVLVGFDGTVHPRGHLPWWGERPRARIDDPRGPAMEAASDGAENIRMFGELAAELLSTKRWPVPGLMFPALSKRLRREARRVIGRMLEDTLVRAATAFDDDEMMDAHHQIDIRALRDEVAHLRMHAEIVDTAALGGLVQNLFVERWAREQRTRSLIASF